MLIALALPIVTNAQLQWFPVGAEWYYGSDDGSYIKGNVEKDTVIGDFNSKIIRFEHATTGLIDNEIFASRNDSVFFYNKLDKSFACIFRANVKIGDTVVWVDKPLYKIWWDSDEQMSELKSKVTRIDTIVISNKSLPIYTTEAIDKYGYGSTSFIKYIGSIDNFFYKEPYACITEDGVPCFRNGGLRCYVDKYLSYGTNCTSLTIEEKSIQEFRVYPIPASNFLKVEGIPTSSVRKIEFVELTGKIVAIDFDVKSDFISIPRLSPGLYYAVFYLNDGTQHTFKFLKPVN